jgi:hypothetical protein
LALLAPASCRAIEEDLVGPHTPSVSTVRVAGEEYSPLPKSLLTKNGFLDFIVTPSDSVSDALKLILTSSESPHAYCGGVSVDPIYLTPKIL